MEYGLGQRTLALEARAVGDGPWTKVPHAAPLEGELRREEEKSKEPGRVGVVVRRFPLSLFRNCSK